MNRFGGLWSSRFPSSNDAPGRSFVSKLSEPRHSSGMTRLELCCHLPGFEVLSKQKITRKPIMSLLTITTLSCAKINRRFAVDRPLEAALLTEPIAIATETQNFSSKSMFGAEPVSNFSIDPITSMNGIPRVMQSRSCCDCKTFSLSSALARYPRNSSARPSRLSIICIR